MLETKHSTPPSAGHIIIEVANPTASRAAVSAHLLLAAVISSLHAYMGKASANVSSTSTLFTIM